MDLQVCRLFRNRRIATMRFGKEEPGETTANSTGLFGGSLLRPSGPPGPIVRLHLRQSSVQEYASSGRRKSAQQSRARTQWSRVQMTLHLLVDQIVASRATQSACRLSLHDALSARWSAYRASLQSHLQLP